MPDGLNSPEVFPPAVGHLIEDLAGKDISGFFNKNIKREMGGFNKDGWDFVNKLFAQAYSRNAESFAAMEQEIQEAENNEFNSPGYKHIFSSLRVKIKLELLEREALRKKGAFEVKAPDLEPPERLEKTQEELDKNLRKELAELEKEIQAQMARCFPPKTEPETLGSSDSMPESLPPRKKAKPRRSIGGFGKWLRYKKTALVRTAVVGLFLMTASVAAIGVPAVAFAPAEPRMPAAGEAGSAFGVRENLSGGVKAEAGMIRERIPDNQAIEYALEAQRLTGVSALDALAIAEIESRMGLMMIPQASVDRGDRGLGQIRPDEWSAIVNDLRPYTLGEPDKLDRGLTGFLAINKVLKRLKGYNPQTPTTVEQAIRKYHGNPATAESNRYWNEFQKARRQWEEKMKVYTSQAYIR